MQTSNSRYIGQSPDATAVKLPLQASPEFVGGHKQLAVPLSIAQLLLGEVAADLYHAPYVLLLGAVDPVLVHRQSLIPFSASRASGLGADSAIRQ